MDLFGHAMMIVRLMQIIIAKNIDIFVVNCTKDIQTFQSVSFAKNIGYRSLKREAMTGKLDETVTKSTAVMAMYNKS